MPRSKAGFKARRETLGLSQQDVADELGVNVRTVKRWETPGWQDAPDDAWEFLADCEARRRFVIDEAERAVLGSPTPKTVAITYYRTQADYDAHGRDEGPFGMANANARAVAESLQRMGYRVKLVYPEERNDNIPMDGGSMWQGEGWYNVEGMVDEGKAVWLESEWMLDEWLEQRPGADVEFYGSGDEPDGAEPDGNFFC